MGEPNRPDSRNHDSHLAEAQRVRSATAPYGVRTPPRCFSIAFVVLPCLASARPRCAAALHYWDRLLTPGVEHLPHLSPLAVRDIERAVRAYGQANGPVVSTAGAYVRPSETVGEDLP